jgi:hypothetical protein
MIDLRMGEFKLNEEHFNPLDFFNEVIELESQQSLMSVIIKEKEIFPKLVMGEKKRFQYMCRKLLHNAVKRGKLSVNFCVAIQV